MSISIGKWTFKRATLWPALYLFNRQHGKLVKRNLDVALVQICKSDGSFRSGITIGMRTVPS